jgi:hypothetical protein
MTSSVKAGRPVPTKDTLNRLPKKRERQQARTLVEQELKNHFAEYANNFPALALFSGSPTLMSLF